MEDKTFELLEKMYNEFTKRFDTVEARLDKIETTLEHDINDKLKILGEQESVTLLS